MEDLATIPDGVLQQANVQLVAVVPSMPELLSVFKEETGFRHALYCDPSANIYRKIGFKCGVVPHDQYPVNNKHVKSSWMLGVLRSTYRTAVLYRDFNADMLVNGGCLVLGRAGSCTAATWTTACSTRCPSTACWSESAESP
ncbi:hypothetical protein BOX15_Mlig011939g2 [Macrostomum lignano]|uniref:Uncharacterized protein n=1 Tax=Macrostomum lignano TaxID=282301 RepID=A0A267GKM2_9PLAT|nr:hypothetical protein BOX15_Mlig011939g2 [Macrostomum lignano]